MDAMLKSQLRAGLITIHRQRQRPIIGEKVLGHTTKPRVGEFRRGEKK